MQTIQKLLLVAFALSALAMVGCEKSYTLKFTNVTSDPLNVQVKEGAFVEREVMVPPDGGKAQTTIKQDENETICYTVQAGNKASKPFNIDKRSPDLMYFHITPNEIIGPVDEHAKVKTKWENKTSGKIGEDFKVE